MADIEAIGVTRLKKVFHFLFQRRSFSRITYINLLKFKFTSFEIQELSDIQEIKFKLYKLDDVGKSDPNKWLVSLLPVRYFSQISPNLYGKFYEKKNSSK